MADNIRWGLDNAYSFSQMKTELTWEGKYDECGNRRTVDIAGCAMPRMACERKSVSAISRIAQSNFCADVPAVLRQTLQMETVHNPCNVGFRLTSQSFCA